MKASVPLIDLYIAATLRPSQDLSIRLEQAGVNLHSAKQVAARVERMILSNPQGVRPAAIVEFFGSPSHNDPFGISYDLVLWPEHRYQWHVDDEGRASHGGFILHQEGELPEWLPRELGTVQKVFQPMHHTGADVERVLGEPDLDLSWFPQQGWHYGPLPDGQDLIFDFDLGLLREITLAPSVVDRYGAGG